MNGARRERAVVLGVLLVGLVVAGCSAGASSSPAAAPTRTGSGYTGTSIATSAPTKPPSPPRVYRGTGDNVVKIDKPDGVAVMAFSCPKCTSNTIVQTDGADLVVVNTIGAYTGKREIDADTGSVTTQLTVKADATWTVTVGGLDLADKSLGNQGVSGKGDDVVLLGGLSSSAAIRNQGGTSNFIIKSFALNINDNQLPVNKIGNYEGTVHLDQPALVEVTSDGNWSISPV